MTVSITGGFPSKAREGRRASPFARFASAVATAAGRPLAFAAACGVIVVWAISGPVFGSSDARQSMIGSGTVIVTFLMVFGIRNAQTRDGTAIRVKLERENEASAPATAPRQERNDGR